MLRCGLEPGSTSSSCGGKGSAILAEEWHAGECEFYLTPTDREIVILQE